jgi:hypothetical protein
MSCAESVMPPPLLVLAGLGVAGAGLGLVCVRCAESAAGRRRRTKRDAGRAFLKIKTAFLPLL